MLLILSASSSTTQSPLASNGSTAWPLSHSRQRCTHFWRFLLNSTPIKTLSPVRTSKSSRRHPVSLAICQSLFLYYTSIYASNRSTVRLFTYHFYNISWLTMSTHSQTHSEPAWPALRVRRRRYDWKKIFSTFSNVHNESSAAHIHTLFAAFLVLITWNHQSRNRPRLKTHMYSHNSPYTTSITHNTTMKHGGFRSTTNKFWDIALNIYPTVALCTDPSVKF